MAFRRRIDRAPDGPIRLRLPDEERTILQALGAELQQLLRDPADPDLRRLFPPAYEDAEDETEYRSIVGGGLEDRKRRALETLRGTVDRETLTEEEAEAWLTALNDARLVLGTRLDVTEDLDLGRIGPHEPRAREFGVYAYLTWLQEQLVEALAAEGQSRS